MTKKARPKEPAGRFFLRLQTASSSAVVSRAGSRR